MAKKPCTAFTARARATFLDTFRATCNVSEAARAIGVSRRTVYNWRDRDPTFAAEWDDAEQEAIDALEKIARDRAIDGSDRMMEILLKAHRPEKYVERLRADINGNVTVNIAGNAADL
jgi:transposase-like protein